MVKLTSKELRTVNFQKAVIKNGENEIADDVFYQLMSHPLFRYRVESHLYSVPFSFPLEKPKGSSISLEEEKAKKEAREIRQSHKDQSIDEEEKEKDKTSSSLKKSTKQTLKLISNSNDLAELEALTFDDREKVAEAAKKKLESLKK